MAATRMTATRMHTHWHTCTRARTHAHTRANKQTNQQTKHTNTRARARAHTHASTRRASSLRARASRSLSSRRARSRATSSCSSCASACRPPPRGHRPGPAGQFDMVAWWFYGFISRSGRAVCRPPRGHRPRAVARTGTPPRRPLSAVSYNCSYVFMALHLAVPAPAASGSLYIRIPGSIVWRFGGV